MILNPVPTTLPSGYLLHSTVVNGFTFYGFNSNPTTAGANGSINSFYPTTKITPQVIVPQYVGVFGLGSIIGFLGGIYPPTLQSTSYSILSNCTPNATPVNSIVVRSDVVNNNCAMPSNILDTFSINASFGSNIEYIPPYKKWISIQPGTYSSLSVVFQDQIFFALQANDSNVLIALLLRQGKKKQLQTNQNSLDSKQNIIPLVKQINFKDEKKCSKNKMF
jgi:hypothetical protein